MKRIIIFCTALSLSACDGGTSSTVRDAFGLDRSSPDEFRVVSRPPLSVPPEFSLKPPKPGAPPRGVAPAREKAASLVLKEEGEDGFSLGPASDDIFGDAFGSALDDFAPMAETSVAPVMASSLDSAADANFLDKAGVQNSDPEIRQKLYLPEEPAEKPKSNFAIENWLNADTSDEVVDPVAESERIRENVDEDKPLNEGEVKTIKREPSTLDMLF